MSHLKIDKFEKYFVTPAKIFRSLSRLVYNVFSVSRFIISFYLFFIFSLITALILICSNLVHICSHRISELTNITHDIFNTLANGESTLVPSQEEPDFLGETSSAYTSGPEDYYDSNYDGSFHAAEGLDENFRVNASLVSTPKKLRAVIVKHRFVTLSWEEPERKSEEVTGYAVIYKVKGSER